MEVVFLDVGQGCCTIIVTPWQRRVVLVDCNAGAGPRTIRYLDESALPLPEVIFISHLHDDHVAGFAAIFRHLIERRIQVERVYTNYVGPTSGKRTADGGQAVVQQLQDLLDGEDDRLCDFRSNEVPYELDGVTLTVIHPSKFDLNEHQDREDMLNNLSGVLQIRYGESSVLLPGDIEGWAASCLVGRCEPTRLAARLMLFPHHGAGWRHRTEGGAPVVQHGQELVSPMNFVRAVAPTWTVLSVGSENDGKWSTYGHPGQAVLDLLGEWHGINGGGFVCTEVTRRCDGAVCEDAGASAMASPVRVPCGGSIRFNLDSDGSVSIDPMMHSKWQREVDRLPHPQCRT